MKALQEVIKLEPLSLEYLGAGVPEHDVRILDMRVENGAEDLEKTLKEFKPDIVGSTGTSCEVSACKKISARAKELDHHVLTVVGGYHATFAPDDYLDSNIDVIVIGEGVFTFREIVEHHERGEGFGAIRGIAIPAGDRLHKTPSRPMCQLDDLPLPDRSLTSHLRHKYSVSLWSTDVAMLRTTLGCTHKCNFCASWKLTDRRYLKRDIESVIEELKTIKESYVYTTDDEFFLDADRAAKLAQRIKGEGISKRYLHYVRTDTICANPELIETWREIGLSEAFVGIDGITDKDLAGFDKTTREQGTEEALAILASNDVACLSALIVNPNWAQEEFKRIYEYGQKLKLECPVFQIMTPLPGTDLFDSMKDQLTTRDWDLWDNTHAVIPTKLSLEDFYKEFRNLMQFSSVEAAPVQYHMRKLGELPTDIQQESLANIQRMIECTEALWMDHQRT